MTEESDLEELIDISGKSLGCTKKQIALVKAAINHPDKTQVEQAKIAGYTGSGIHTTASKAFASNGFKKLFKLAKTTKNADETETALPEEILKLLSINARAGDVRSQEIVLKHHEGKERESNDSNYKSVPDILTTLCSSGEKLGESSRKYKIAVALDSYYLHFNNSCEWHPSEEAIQIISKYPPLLELLGKDCLEFYGINNAELAA